MAGARGSGAEVGLVVPDPATNQIILSQRATQVAPPNGPTVVKSIGPVTIGTILSASLLKGTASAKWNPAGCVLGADLSNGTGEAADAAVLGATPATAAVGAPGDAQTSSRQTLVPQQNQAGATVGNNFGLMSEVAGHESTTAPVNLLSGALNVTIVGPFGLRAVATGIPGTSYVQETYPSAVNITGALGVPIINIPLGPGGLAVQPAPITIPLVGTLTLQVAAPPHAIGDVTAPPTIAADGTSVSAATDVVHLTLVAAGITVIDVREGHMVASATVPAGGIACNLDVNKVAQPATVNPGDTFQYLISVHNPFECTLTGVVVDDTITTSGGVRYTVVSSAPPANTSSNSALHWNDVGPIAPGATKQLVINIKVASNSSGGTFTDKVAAHGSCAVGNAQGVSTVISTTGGTTITSPKVGGGRVLPVTGGQDGRFYAVALLVGLAAVAAGRKGFASLLKSGA